MTDTERAQFRMGCLIEAGKIKQSLNAHTDVKGDNDKTVIDIAKDYANFVLGNL